MKVLIYTSVGSNFLQIFWKLVPKLLFSLDLFEQKRQYKRWNYLNCSSYEEINKKTSWFCKKTKNQNISVPLFYYDHVLKRYKENS